MLHPGKPTNWQSFLWIMTGFNKMVDAWAKLSNLPVIGDIVRFPVHKDRFEVQWVPINKRLEGGSKVVPLDLLRELIRKTSHRVITFQCGCRQSWGCQHHSHEIGCLYLGEATKDMDSSFGKHATVEEALAHLDRAINSGLVPQVGQIDMDALWLCCIPKTHFATVCFCCDCCCIDRRYGTVWSNELMDLLLKLEGLSVKVTDACVGCGECLEKCFVGAISMQDDHAQINDQVCKGCGVCVEQCPADAITIEVTDGNAMKKAFFERIERRVDVYSSIPGKKINTVERGKIPHPRHGLENPKYKHSREK